ncbi:hypothetical protein WJX79_003733 [Trebouxia sp. C0005]
MNDLMSVGMHRLWKDKFVRELKPFAGMQHLDVAGGTGDVAFRVLDQITQLEDEQQEQRAERRPTQQSLTPKDWTLLRGMLSPCPFQTEAHRVLKVGGRFLCLEFSHVTLPGLKQIYDAYSFNVIPEIGRTVANDKASYEYLVESIRKFPEQEAFASMIRAAGFSNVRYENLQGGIVAIHSGFKLK